MPLLGAVSPNTLLASLCSLVPGLTRSQPMVQETLWQSETGVWAT